MQQKYKPGDILTTADGMKGLVVMVHQHKVAGTLYSILIEGQLAVIDEAQVTYHKQDQLNER
jgi:hypothetical protein